jgi:hypothetical protein
MIVVEALDALVVRVAVFVVFTEQTWVVRVTSHAAGAVAVAVAITTAARAGSPGVAVTTSGAVAVTVTIAVAVASTTSGGGVAVAVALGGRATQVVLTILEAVLTAHASQAGARQQ